MIHYQVALSLQRKEIVKEDDVYISSEGHMEE